MDSPRLGVISSRWHSTWAGGSSSREKARVAVRSWPMIAAAWMPLPMTSPTTSPTLPSGRGSTSNQSPPHGTDRGQIPGGDLQAVQVAWLLGEQAALEGERGVAFPGVEPGVVDAQGGADGQFAGEGEVLLVERPGVDGAVQAEGAEHTAAGDQRGGDIRVHALAQQHPPGVVVPGDPPYVLLRHVRHQDRPGLADALGDQPGGVVAGDLADRVRRVDGVGGVAAWRRRAPGSGRSRRSTPGAWPRGAPRSPGRRRPRGRRAGARSHRPAPGRSGADPAWCRRGRSRRRSRPAARAPRRSRWSPGGVGRCP